MNNIGKNKRRQLEVEDTVHNVILSVDSEEECDFIHWLNEAKELSVINDFQYQPSPFNLFDQVKYINIDKKEKILFKNHIYSTDFMITFNGNVQRELAKELNVTYNQLSTECSVYIDTKGLFNRNARSFSIDRKWVWNKFKIFIYELIPAKFFKKFGVPEKCKMTKKTKKPRKIFQGLKGLKEVFLKNFK